MRISVIVTTYNNPKALRAVLLGYARQDDAGFDVIVADDGSGPATRELVDNLRPLLPYELTHVWQEDKGFRAAAIRNRAIAASKSEYLVFTDGDCIPSSRFVRVHRLLAEPGWFLSGNRILLNEDLARAVLDQELDLSGWSWMQGVQCWLRRDINRMMPLVLLPDGQWRKMAPRRWAGCVTANLSAWRQDLLKVNGFDESYCGWGLEDSDLVVRLMHAGIFHKSARFGAFIWHLWHPYNDRERLSDNEARFDSLLDSDRIGCPSGVNQYL